MDADSEGNNRTQPRLANVRAPKTTTVCLVSASSSANDTTEEVGETDRLLGRAEELENQSTGEDKYVEVL